MRKSEIVRKTKETDISLSLDIDGSGVYDIKTGVGFFDHMLELFTRHGRFDMTVRCDGDTWVDSHHTVEDVGIVMGQAFKEALGDKKGIKRYGEMLLPMDEALILVALDISGRNYLGYDVEFASMKVTDGSNEMRQMMVGSFDSELAEEFLMAFSREMGLTLHVKKLAGKNTHHIIEATFKGLARALAKACEIDERFKDEVPSTKGSL
ncbi:MAG: imidazoleglycerol-phosphate dehydratase HisB [Firmicutes bacterium]|nr:imidazoleglycerol-phosphate dehydratase HisB [Bacillota bacterium]